jgi:RNA polymerase sigma-70 factor (ECF subfamily)
VHAPESSVTDFALLGQFFDDYRPRLLAMLRRRIDPRLAVRVDPEEVLAEAFLDARRRWPQFRDRGSASAYAWLYRVTFDRLIETWRHQTRGRRDLHRDLPWPEESSVLMGLSLVNPGTSPSEAVARGELRERMQQAIELLKDDDREVLWMRQYEQLTFGEIGQVLDISEDAATLRYVRALKRLKKAWQAMHPE